MSCFQSQALWWKGSFAWSSLALRGLAAIDLGGLPRPVLSTWDLSLAACLPSGPTYGILRAGFILWTLWTWVSPSFPRGAPLHFPVGPRHIVLAGYLYEHTQTRRRHH